MDIETHNNYYSCPDASSILHDDSEISASLWLNGLALLNAHNSTDYVPSTAEVRNAFLKKNCHIMETKSL